MLQEERRFAHREILRLSPHIVLRAKDSLSLGSGSQHGGHLRLRHNGVRRLHLDRNGALRGYRKLQQLINGKNRKRPKVESAQTAFLRGHSPRYQKLKHRL
jgi:hypothetical protein